MPCYFGQVVSREGWQMDPISREQLYVSEACICVELHSISTSSSKRRDSAGMCIMERDPLPPLFGDGELASGLQAAFPQGMPRRLLVVGTGGTGKTVLTKQIVVACCQAQLEARGCAVVPFRFALTRVAPLLDGAEQDVWAPLRKCMEYECLG